MEFTDLKTFWEYRTKAARLQLSYAEFTEFFKYCIEHEEKIKGFFSALTMDKLKRIIIVRSGDKKEDAISSLYDNVLSAFNLSGSVMYSPFSGETYKSALTAKIEAQTEEDYFAAIAEKEADKAEKEKALSNPETLEEFRVFIQTKGAAELTTDQYKRYIFLLAESEQGVEERKKITSVPKVETGGVEMELKESEHTIKKIPLFVVQLKTRVERDIYQALNLRAKRLGGYYSSYSKGGAIPGFVFESKEAAENFIKTDQYITNEEAVKAREEKREINRAETLEEKAAALAEKGNEILNAERKDNTHRRARMAASAEARGAHMVKIAKIIENIATGINNETLKFLTRVNAVTQVEDLNGLLIRARYEKQKAENLQGDQRQIPINDDLVRYVKYPYPLFYNQNILRDIEKLKEAPGRKLAAARIIKKVKAYEREKLEYTTFKYGVDDLKTVFSDPYKDYNQWNALYYRDEILRYERVQKLGLTTPALLKAALFEFLALRPGSILSPEQEAKQKVKEIERQFIGKKIPGFFPTPVELAESVIDLAEIKPGNTILEPSAGLGHIAELLRAEYPENDLKLVEYNVSLAEALKQKGFEVDNSDFLTYQGGPFDRIVMNPPFENLEDINHVQHAFTLLKPGGRLVAIMANNKQGERAKVKEFADFVSNYGYSETNPEGSFKSAFNPTGVNTITVVLDKPEAPETNERQQQAIKDLEEQNQKYYAALKKVQSKQIEPSEFFEISQNVKAAKKEIVKKFKEEKQEQEPGQPDTAQKLKLLLLKKKAIDLMLQLHE